MTRDSDRFRRQTKRSAYLHSDILRVGRIFTHRCQRDSPTVKRRVL